MISFGVSLFDLKNITHVYFANSSTITKVHICPLKVVVLIGPNKSCETYEEVNYWSDIALIKK